MSASPYDCQSCGACCATFDVWIRGEERDRFERSPRLVQLTVDYHSPSGWQERFMRRDEQSGRCAALEGPLHQCRCVIYDDRPSLCREFEAGSPECLTSRKAFGYAV